MNDKEKIDYLLFAKQRKNYGSLSTVAAMDLPCSEQSEEAEAAMSNLQSAFSGFLHEFVSSLSRIGALTEMAVSVLYRRNNKFDFVLDSGSPFPPSESVYLSCPNDNNIVLAPINSVHHDEGDNARETISPSKQIRTASWYCSSGL